MSTPKAAAVAPPSILTASMDEYVSRVLAKIPEKRRGVIGVAASNAGVAFNAGVRFTDDLTGVGFVSRTKGQGWTYGARGQWVFGSR